MNDEDNKSIKITKFAQEMVLLASNFKNGGYKKYVRMK